MIRSPVVRGGASLTRQNGLFYFRIMSPRKYLAGVALSVSMLTVSWAAQRTILKALPACPDIKDFTDWFEAMEKGNASRAVDIIAGQGCVWGNKCDVVDSERTQSQTAR